MPLRRAARSAGTCDVRRCSEHVGAIAAGGKATMSEVRYDPVLAMGGRCATTASEVVTVNDRAGIPLCRGCLSGQVEKIPSTSAIQFKGEVFHCHDDPNSNVSTVRGGQASH